jgi:hypothetical protein
VRKRSKCSAESRNIVCTRVQANKTNIGCEHEQCVVCYTLYRIRTRECAACCTLHHRMRTKECDACCTLYPHRTLRGNTSEMKRDCMRKRSKMQGKCSSIECTTVQTNKLCVQIATSIGCEHEECVACYTLYRMRTRECTAYCTLYHRMRTKECAARYTLKPESHLEKDNWVIWKTKDTKWTQELQRAGFHQLLSLNKNTRVDCWGNKIKGW